MRIGCSGMTHRHSGLKAHIWLGVNALHTASQCYCTHTPSGNALWSTDRWTRKRSKSELQCCVCMAMDLVCVQCSVCIGIDLVWLRSLSKSALVCDDSNFNVALFYWNICSSNDILHWYRPVFYFIFIKSNKLKAIFNCILTVRGTMSMAPKHKKNHLKHVYIHTNIHAFHLNVA